MALEEWARSFKADGQLCPWCGRTVQMLYAVFDVLWLCEYCHEETVDEGRHGEAA